MNTVPVFCLLLGVSSDHAQPITGQVTDVICPVIGRAQPELYLSKREKTDPGPCPVPGLSVMVQRTRQTRDASLDHFHLGDFRHFIFH